MKSLIFTIAFLLCALTYTQAQSIEKRTRIRYLFTLMKQDSLMMKQIDAQVAMSRNFTTMGRDMAKNTGIDMPVDSAMIKRQEVFVEKMVKTTKENTMKLLEDMVEIYDRYFTSAEIEAFCTFYESPAGKKMIASTPAITQDISTQSMTKYQPQIMKLMKEYIDESKRQIDQKYKN